MPSLPLLALACGTDLYIPARQSAMRRFSAVFLHSGADTTVCHYRRRLSTGRSSMPSMQMLQHAHATAPAGDRVQLTTRGVHAAAGLIAPGGAPPSAAAASSWGLLRVAASERSVGRRDHPTRLLVRCWVCARY